MKITVKRVYEPAERGDGARVLVDRLWPRGISKDRVGLWLKDVAPSDALRRWYDHVPERWPAFRSKYRKELVSHPDEVLKLRQIAKRRTLTLLYGARDTERNEAVVLAEFLKAHKLPAKKVKASA